MMSRGRQGRKCGERASYTTRTLQGRDAGRRTAASLPPTAKASGERWKGPSTGRLRCWRGRASRSAPGA
eukprot:2567475-Prymnesium_polylepis.2